MSNWIDICDLEDVPRLGTRVLRAVDMDIALFRTARGDVFALEDKCPHKGGPLSQGLVHGSQVTCPLHNWVLNLKDGKAVAPDVGCVRTFAVRVDQERVFLELPVLADETRAGNKVTA